MHEVLVAYRRAEFPFPSLDELLRRACERILEGFRDIEEAKEHAASCPIFFDGRGFEVKGATLRDAIALVERDDRFRPPRK